MSKLKLTIGDVLVTKTKAIIRGVKIGDEVNNTFAQGAKIAVTKDNIFLLSQMGHVFETAPDAIPEEHVATVATVEKKTRAPRKPKQKTADVATVV